jgi:glucose/arabinose dehydrogenase
MSLSVASIVIAALLSASTAIAAPPNATKSGAAAFDDWHADAPGVRRLIKISDLPPPAQTESAENFPTVVGRPANAKPNVPPGFSVELIASGLTGPRTLRQAPNGDLFVANGKANKITVYRMGAGSAQPVSASVFATGLYQPHGILFYPAGPDPKWVYVANSHSVVRFPYKNGDLKATGKPERIIDYIPAPHHWTRDLALSPDGKTMYVAVGSGSNIALDMFPKPFEGLDAWNKTHPIGAAWDTEERRADVLAFDPNGKNEKIFVTGVRNCSGLTFQPGTGALWCAVNERDGLGDNTPFDYVAHVRQGTFFGWPWYYLGANEDPRRKGERPDLANSVSIPEVLLQAHSAPIAITFYQGKNFPAEYNGDAFVTLHGSWNRRTRTGQKVVRVIFKDGKATGEYEDFMTGFVVSDKEVWGRPTGITVARDGSLLVSEDGNGTIWRVTHRP